MALNAAIIAITIVIWLIVVFITRAIFRATIFRDAHRLGTGLSEATIARDLGPLFDRYITRDSKIWITGSDGTPLYRLLYPWHRRLKRWLRRGCKIDYLLIEPSPRGKKAFADLARRFGEQLRVFVVDSADEVAESNSASFAKRMRTFHPTLVQNSGNRLMWIEGNHPAHSTTAYDCEFVPPPVANSDDRFEEYLEMIETVRDGPAHRLET